MEFPELVNQAAVNFEAEAAAADVQPVELDLLVEHSDKELWCWAAVSLGVRKGFRNLSKTMQCEIATETHNQDHGNGSHFVCCLPVLNHPDKDCNQAHTLKEPLAQHHRQTIS